MDTKYKVIAGVSIVALSFAAGRYSVPLQVKEEKAKADNSVVERQKDIVTKVVTVTKPNGEKVRTKDVVETVHTDRKNDIKEIESKTVTKDSDKFYISGLTGIDIASKSFMYGLSLQKNIIGPIIGGAFGFNTGVYGLSIGLQF